jgi:hypothetical protein
LLIPDAGWLQSLVASIIGQTFSAMRRVSQLLPIVRGKSEFLANEKGR